MAITALPTAGASRDSKPTATARQDSPAAPQGRERDLLLARAAENLAVQVPTAQRSV